MRKLTIALTKGRLADQTLSLFEQIGISCEEMKDPKCTLTDEQWCGLLNSYIRRESPEKCAAGIGIRPIQADRWYIRLSLDIVRKAITDTYRS